MIKKIITALLLFLIFYLGLHNYLKYKRKLGTGNVVRMLECDATQVQRISVVRQNKEKKDESFEIFREKGAAGANANQENRWYFAGGVIGEVDRAVGDRVASSLCQASPVESLKFSPEIINLASKDLIRLKIRQEDGITSDVWLGGVDARRGMIVEVKEGHTAGFYRIPLMLRQLLEQEVETLRNKKVSLYEPDSLQEISLLKADKSEIGFTREGTSWNVVTAGISKRGNEEAEKFGTRLFSLKAVSVLDSEFSSADCEGVRADYQIRGRAVDQSVEVLKIWKEAKKPDALVACSSLRAQKFRVHIELEKYLNVAAKKLVL